MAQQSNSFSLALGGGGVKGLAHIALLKKLDALGVKPQAIAGTSMGAILGALYASGVSGQEIENRVRAHIVNPGEQLKDWYKKRKHLFAWTKVFSFDAAKGGFIAAEGLFEHLFSEIIDKEFCDLDHPFTAVATDFHRGEAVTLSSGSVYQAVKASMAVPGVFAPIKFRDRLLVDGCLVNNVPVDAVHGKADITLASDVISLPSEQSPSAMQVVAGAMQVMLSAATCHHLSSYPSDFIFKPNTDGIDSFDFRKIDLVLQRGEAAIERCASDLEKRLTR